MSRAMACSLGALMAGAAISGKAQEPGRSTARAIGNSASTARSISARLAVLWMTGRWPRKLVDHRNCIKSDDHWDNLRDATHSQNGANSHARKGCKGVIRTRGKYEARIKVNYRNIYLGRFDSAERAHAVYAAAAEKHFGEFAR